MKQLTIARVDEAPVCGDGRAAAWQHAAWQVLPRVGEGHMTYATRAKVLYSASALHFLFDCEDRRLTCTKTEDFDDIYKEDVIEVFLWPDESQTLYFEYEISPLGVQLPILVPNHKGRFMGWRPWHYEGGRMIQAATAVRGGVKASMAAVSGWTAEFAVPFALFTGLGNTPPGPGTHWRANMYRIDYDDGPATQWAWCEETGCNFHAFRSFGEFVFA